METIKQMKDYNQIVISTSDETKQSIPLNVMLWLALGILTGGAVMFGLFMGANFIAKI